MNIILIDDHITYTSALGKKLTKDGFKVNIFNSIQSYIHKESDIYIIDLHLERKSFGLIEDIRSKTNKPIIVLSAYDNHDYIMRAIESGADAYIVKLTPYNELLIKIKGLIKFYNRLIGNNL